MTLPKVSAITCTYGRYRCVERIIKMIQEQDYPSDRIEHIIYNTDVEFPIVLDDTLLRKNITVVNNNTDLTTHQPYTNFGDIRRDSLLFATGKYTILVDDDDIFLNWNTRQCVNGITKYEGCLAWKPAFSLFEQPDRIVKVGNTLEASYIIDTEFLRQTGFRPSNGSESLQWVEAIQYTPQMIVDEESAAGYSYRWNDSELAPHKQSGDGVDDPTNFDRHKNGSQDHATRPLTLLETNAIVEPYYEYFRNNPTDWHPDLIDKYVRQYL
jgi:glycosyltransferase involved in cell wall biosynthesis